MQSVYSTQKDNQGLGLPGRLYRNTYDKDSLKWGSFCFASERPNRREPQEGLSMKYSDITALLIIWIPFIYLIHYAIRVYYREEDEE